MDTKGRIRNIWHLMLHRCYNEKNKSFKNYGARGITVCDEWRDFNNFHQWAVNSGYEYGNGLTLDRIDNNGSYSPDNCRWATMKEQANNRRTNTIISFNGVEKTLTEWAESIGITVECLFRRFLYGWSMERAMKTPLGKKHYITYNGKTQQLYEWANELGYGYDMLERRINYHGWSVERALTTPPRKRSANNPTNKIGF